MVWDKNRVEKVEQLINNVVDSTASTDLFLSIGSKDDFKSFVRDIIHKHYQDAVDEEVLRKRISSELGKWIQNQAVMHYPHGPRFRYSDQRNHGAVVNGTDSQRPKAKL